MAVDFDLSSHLEDDVTVYDLFFGDDFNGYDHFMFSFPC